MLLLDTAIYAIDTYYEEIRNPVQILTVEFVFLFKLSREICENCTPNMNMMQNLTLDGVTMSMINSNYYKPILTSILHTIMLIFWASSFPIMVYNNSLL